MNQDPPLSPPADPPPSPPAGDPAQRPAYIPEKFWDGTAGAPRVEDLAKSYAKLEGERGKIKESLSAEIKAELRKGAPAKPEEYKIALPEGVGDVVLLDKIADDFQPEPGKTYSMLKADSPLLKSAAAAAHKYGMPQAEFSQLIGELAREVGQRVPTAEEAAAQRTEFFKQLGEQGEQRFTHTSQKLAAVLGDKAPALNLEHASPQEFEAIEALLEKAGQAKFSAGAATVPAAKSQAELEEIMASPDYYVNKEKQKIVTDGFAKLYPGKVNISNPNAAR